MIVICPECHENVSCPDDASCIEAVPQHGVCIGAGRVGFVLPRPLGDEQPVTPKPQKSWWEQQR